MPINARSLFRCAVAVGVLLVLGPACVLAQKGLKISVGDDPSMKQGTPKLVFVEVSDFQCPYCGQGAREVLPQILEKYVRTGKVELIYLDHPLQMHQYAFKAAEAAACANDQGKFWEMHDRLFANQQALAPDQLPDYAKDLGLDMAAFQKCLSSGRQAGKIREDMRVAQVLGITGTPAYLLGRRLPGSDKIQVLEVVKGLPPYEELEKKIDELLAME